MLVTFIVLKLGLTFDDNKEEFIKKFKRTYWVNADALFTMKIIENIRRNKWRLVVVIDQEKDDDDKE